MEGKETQKEPENLTKLRRQRTQSATEAGTKYQSRELLREERTAQRESSGFLQRDPLLSPTKYSSSQVCEKHLRLMRNLPKRIRRNSPGNSHRAQNGLYFYHSEWNNFIADIQVGREKNQYVQKKHEGYKKDPNLASKDEKINIRVKKNIRWD